jgi:hypothetical protein
MVYECETTMSLAVVFVLSKSSSYVGKGNTDKRQKDNACKKASKTYQE